jgi:colanic acid/amylovoran biosynthesis protein
MNILITNAYSSQNKGDAAIIIATTEGLKRYAPDTRITVSARHISPQDHKLYGVPTITSLMTLARPINPNNKNFLRRNLRDLYIFFISLLWGLTFRFLKKDFSGILSDNLKKILSTYREADLVIACGGGYFQGNSSLRGLSALLAITYQFSFGSIIGKPVYLAAQSIGPFRGTTAKLLAKLILKKVRLIESREPVTTNLLMHLGLSDQTYETTDLAFAMSTKNKPEAKQLLDDYDLDPEKPIIGLSLKNYFINPEDQSYFEKEIASLVRWLIYRYQAQVCFFPQTVCTALNDDDRTCAQRLKKELDHHHFIPLEEDLNPHTLDSLSDFFFFHIGTRMHSNIFALRHRVPVIAIAYEAKTNGLMRQLDLGDWVIPIESFSAKTAQKLCARLFDPKDYRAYKKKLRQQLPQMRSLATQSIELILDDFHQRQT